MDCMQCGNEFEAKRSTAKYCSANCRWLAHNAKDVPTLSPTLKDEIDYDGPLTPDGFVPVGEQLGYERKEVRPGEFIYVVPKPGQPEYEGSVKRERAIVAARPGGVFTDLYLKPYQEDKVKSQASLEHGVCRYCGVKIDEILVCCNDCAEARPLRYIGA